jgi:hypothetical protein
VLLLLRLLADGVLVVHHGPPLRVREHATAGVATTRGIPLRDCSDATAPEWGHRTFVTIAADGEPRHGS